MMDVDHRISSVDQTEVQHSRVSHCCAREVCRRYKVDTNVYSLRGACWDRLFDSQRYYGMVN